MNLISFILFVVAYFLIFLFQTLCSLAYYAERSRHPVHRHPYQDEMSERRARRDQKCLIYELTLMLS